MPANPERQRYTDLVESEIGQRTGKVIVEGLAKITGEVTANPNHEIKKETIIDFVHNRRGEKRTPKQPKL